MRMGLFGLHSASEQPEILLMFRNQVASELLMKNERIRQHWAFPAQRWGAGAGPGTSCPPSHGLCRWLGPARPLPPLCHSWSLRTSEFADLWGPGPSQRIPSCDPFLLSKVKAECAGGPDRSQRAGLPALPPLSPRIRSLPPCTERVLRPGRGSCTRPGVLSGPGRLRVQTSARPRRATRTGIPGTLRVPVPWTAGHTASALLTAAAGETAPSPGAWPQHCCARTVHCARHHPRPCPVPARALLPHRGQSEPSGHSGLPSYTLPWLLAASLRATSRPWPTSSRRPGVTPLRGPSEFPGRAEHTVLCLLRPVPLAPTQAQRLLNTEHFRLREHVPGCNCGSFL